MSNILDTIAEYACCRTEQAKKNISALDMRRLAEEKTRETRELKRDFLFERELGKAEITFICECKKASPSKGLIAPDFPYLEIAKEYETAGAGAISVLTEPKWFLGSNEYLREIAQNVNIPCLRKDFTVDVHNSERLRRLVPKEVMFVAESGIKTAQDIDVLRAADVNGVLIGETMMLSDDKSVMLKSLRGY